MDDLVTIFNDSRNRDILSAANLESGISTKELAKVLNVKISNLYYPIQKLTEIQLLEVVGTRQIKNLTEKLYRSSSIFQSDSQSLYLTQEYAKSHSDLLMADFLAHQQDDRIAYEVNLNEIKEKEITDDEFMTWISGTAEIKANQKADFVKDFLSLIKKYELKDGSGLNSKEFVIDFSMYAKDND